MQLNSNGREIALAKNVAFLDNSKLDCPTFVFQGGFGITHKGKYLNDVDVLSKKMIKVNDAEEDFNQELSNLKILRHVNIPLFYGISQDKGQMILIQELVHGDTLTKYLKEKHLDEMEKLLILIDLAKVLEYLHGNRIIHKDLKPDNIMIDYRTLKLYLIDFGISKAINKNSQANHTVSVAAGTYFYMAPETYDFVDNSKKGSERGATGFFNCSTKFDVWSFGCVSDEVISGNKPWLGDENLALTNLKIKREYQFQKIEHIPKYNQFIKNCCEIDLQLRFDIEQAKQALMKMFFKMFTGELRKLVDKTKFHHDIHFLTKFTSPRLSTDDLT